MGKTVKMEGSWLGDASGIRLRKSIAALKVGNLLYSERLKELGLCNLSKLRVT